MTGVVHRVLRHHETLYGRQEQKKGLDWRLTASAVAVQPMMGQYFMKRIRAVTEILATAHLFSTVRRADVPTRDEG